MNRLKRHLFDQFRRPRGPLGVLAGRIMAKDPSKRERSPWTVGLLGLTGGERVLEVGYGPGLGIAAALGLVGAEGEVVGLDFSATMQRMALRRVRRMRPRAPGRVRLVVADAAGPLPADIGTFDAVFSCNVWRMWPDQPVVLERLRTLLKPGGVIAVTDLPPHGNVTRATTEATRDRIVEQLAAAGFTDIRSEFLELEPAPAVCVLAVAPSHSRMNSSR